MSRKTRIPALLSMFVPSKGCKEKKAAIPMGSRYNKEYEGPNPDLKAGKRDFYFGKPDPLSCRNSFLKRMALRKPGAAIEFQKLIPD